MPTLSAKEMAELDRRLLMDFHIDLSMLMENAGRSLALQARTELGATVGKRVLVMAGKGNNGGGGMVAARHLHNWGAAVEVVLSAQADELKELPSKQLGILRRMGVTVVQSSPVTMGRYDLIVDALLGYSQRGAPRGKVAELVRSANASHRRVLCLDVPTGLDPESGRANDPCINGSLTLTLALPKTGLVLRRAKPFVGDLLLADIGVPRSAYEALGVNLPIFKEGPIVRLNGRNLVAEDEPRRASPKSSRVSSPDYKGQSNG